VPDPAEHPSSPTLPTAEQPCTHRIEARRTNTGQITQVYEVCSACETWLVDPAEHPSGPICAACGGTDAPVVDVPLHPKCAEHLNGSPDRCDWIEAGQPYPNECGRTLPCDRHSTDAEGHPFGFTNLAQEHPSGSPQTEARRLMAEGTDSDTGDVWLHRDDAAKVFSALAAARREPLDVPTEPLQLRAAMWLNHGHDGLYGDDGEMQCPRFPPADFLRDHIDALIAHIDFSSIPAHKENSDD
jgi:hypothetical protein